MEDRHEHCHQRDRRLLITPDSSEPTPSVKIHITVLKVVQLFNQLASVGAFCGSIIQQEAQNAHAWRVLSQEPFGAVAQWGNLVVVLLVLVAAAISQIWTGLDEDDAKSDYWRDGKNENIETEKEDWDWRIGYAS